MSPNLFYLICMGLLLVVCVATGIYFLAKPKGKGIPIEERAEWVSKLNISAEAKAVRLKELHKQTAKIFTKKWFLEYWHGERTPFYAYWTWMFIGRIIATFTLMLPSMWLLKNNSNNPTGLSLILETTFFIYVLFTEILLWKNAKNAISLRRNLAIQGLVIYFLGNTLISIF